MLLGKLNSWWVVALIPILWLFTLSLKPVLQTIENIAVQDVRLTAAIVIHERAKLEPLVEYTVIVSETLTGSWHAYVQDEKGEKLCGGYGAGVYNRQQNGTRWMGFEYFLGASCEVPKVKYSVCVHYVVSVLGKEEEIVFGPVCSIPGFSIHLGQPLQ